MRVALLADVHGNAAALEAVLADVDADAHVFLGDYFLFGPRPCEVRDIMDDLGWPAIEGNTDRYIRDADPSHVFAPLIRSYNERLGAVPPYPFAHRIEPGLLLVHANPSNLEDLLITEPGEFAPHPVTDEEEAARLMAGVDAELTVYGHIHYPSRGVAAGREVASIGAVGMPFDGDPRAAYAIATRNAEGWCLEHRRVLYNYRAVADEILAEGTPFADVRAQRILESRPIRFLRG